MDKKELEEKLEQEIKSFNEVPLSVDDKIEKAFMKIDAKKEKRISKFNFGKITKLVAEITTIAFLAGNGVAFATGNPNIYSWVLNKIGIQKEYEEYKEVLNLVQEDNGLKVTLESYAYDEQTFIAKFIIDDLQSKISENADLENFYSTQSLIFNGGSSKIDVLEAFNEYHICRTAPNKYELYSIVKYSNYAREDLNKVVFTINNVKIDETEFVGEWKYSIDINEEQYSKNNLCILNINKKIDKNIYLNNIVIKKSSILGTIEPDYEYEKDDPMELLIVVSDKNGNILGMLKSRDGAISGYNENIMYANKLIEENDYILSIYVHYEFVDGCFDNTVLNAKKIDDIKVKPVYESNFIYKYSTEYISKKD